MMHCLEKDGYDEERAEMALYDEFRSRPQNMAAACQKAHRKLQDMFVLHWSGHWSVWLGLIWALRPVVEALVNQVGVEGSKHDWEQVGKDALPHDYPGEYYAHIACPAIP